MNISRHGKIARLPEQIQRDPTAHRPGPAKTAPATHEPCQIVSCAGPGAGGEFGFFLCAPPSKIHPMAFFWRWFLILFALALGAGQSFGASYENRAYAAALQAFHDHFYPLAETRLTQFLQNYHRSTNAPMAVLYLAQAEYYQKNYPAATNRLTDAANLARAKAAGVADRYNYWLAEAQFAQGNLPVAAQTFSSVAENFPKSPLAVSAAVEAAAAYAKLGQWTDADNLLDDTNGLFQSAAHLDPANEQVANGRLLQAESKCAQQAFVAATHILNLLNPATLAPEQKWKRSYLLYRAQLGNNDLDAALAATTNLLQLARAGQGDVWATNLAESVASHASVLEHQGLLADAAAALKENLSGPIPVPQQQQTILKLADLAIAQQNLTNAEAQLEGFLAQFPDSSAAETALLALGELYLTNYLAQPSATNYLDLAQSKLGQISTNSPLAGKAWLDRGWCDWLAAKVAEDAGDFSTAGQKISDSLADFTVAAQWLPVSVDLAVARFKMGDAEFTRNNFTNAEINYLAVLDDFPALPEVAASFGSRARYQILRARLALGNAAGVDEIIRPLLGDFFTNAPAATNLLLAGQGLSDFDSPAKARDVFREFELAYTNSPLLPQVAFAIARTFERDQNWPAATNQYQAWLRTYPASELRPQVEYARAWAVSQAGNDTRAFELFTNFIAEYPSNTELTPLSYWWVADHYFQLGGTNFTVAEYNYELIFQNFPTNDLARQAQLMAGRAAMGHSNFKSAIHSYLDSLLDDTNCPPGLAMQARFAYCEALRQMTDTNYDNLHTATNILVTQICAMYPTNLPGALAWSEAGDCDLQMGAYDAATNAYAQVLISPAATQELRYRAQVGLGIVLEKKAEGQPDDVQKSLLDLAMQNYEAVFDPEAGAQSEFWRKKAGLQILTLNARTGTLKGDALNAFISKMERLFPQSKDSLEQKRLTSRN
jgi:TolA-binding protein